MTVPVQRRLVLMRHAKSAWPHGVPDHERPLAGKGRRNAGAARDWFRLEGPRPDLVLCSDAQRARHTWEIVATGLVAAPRWRIEPALYGADARTVIDLAHAVGQEPAGDDVHVLVMIGHEPTMSAATLLLAGDGSDPNAVARVARKFPTNAVAVLQFAGDWAELDAGRAALLTFAVPRA